MKRIQKSLLSFGLTADAILGVGLLAERMADPFNRYEQDYTLEGSSGRSEVSYITSNYYENGKKHDDRLGDALLGLTIVSFAGVLALRTLQPAHDLHISPSVPGH
jgi:hypothetical protein